MDISDIIRQLAISALPVLVAITFHELSHGFIAYKLGDPTAKMMGRLTINPIAHIDPIGTILMPVMMLIFTNGQFVFGYAKPVPINPMNFKNPRKDMAISAAGGPAMNIVLAFLSLIILKFGVMPLMSFASEGVGSQILVPLGMMLKTSIVMNVVLASFNLIPIPPLDGGRIAVGLLPYKHAMSFSKIEPFGFIIVIILIATGMSDYFVLPLVRFFLSFLGLF